MAETKNDFDVAKALFEELEGIEKERQHRILRWVAESLGLSLSLKHHAGSDPASERLERHGESAESLPGTPHADQAGSGDIKTFVEAKNPKSDIQFAAVVAYYSRFQAGPDERKESITPAILQDAARLAGRKRLTKPHVTLNNAKKQGYLDSAGRGEFKINSVGENLVAMTLPGQQNESHVARVRRQKPKKAVLKRGKD